MNLSAKPRGSRNVSDEPNSPATVEKRANKGVSLPTSDKKSALYIVPLINSP